MNSTITEDQKNYIISKLQDTFTNELDLEKFITKLSDDINEIHSLTTSINNFITNPNSNSNQTKNKKVQKTVDFSQSQLSARKPLMTDRTKETTTVKKFFTKTLPKSKDKVIKQDTTRVNHHQKRLTNDLSTDKIKRQTTNIDEKNKYNKKNNNNNYKTINREKNLNANKSFDNIKKAIQKSFISTDTKTKDNDNKKNDKKLVRKITMDKSIGKNKKNDVSKSVDKKNNLTRHKTSDNIFSNKSKTNKKGKETKKNTENTNQITQIKQIRDIDDLKEKEKPLTENKIIKEELKKEVKKEIIINYKNKTFTSSNYLESLFLALNSGFFNPMQKLKLFINIRDFYKLFNKQEMIKELINYYSLKGNMGTGGNKGKENELFKPSATSIKGLKFLDDEEKNKILKEKQDPIIIDFFRLILILLDEYDKNIFEENDKKIIEKLFIETFNKYKVKSIKELMIKRFIDILVIINDEQFEMIQKFTKEKPELLLPSSLIKYSRTVSFFAIFIKELYSYLCTKNDQGVYYYKIRFKNTDNIYRNKINNLKKYLA